MSPALAFLVVIPPAVAWIPYLRRLYAFGEFHTRVRNEGRRASLLPLAVTIVLGAVAGTVASVLPIGAWSPWIVAIPTMVGVTWVCARMSAAVRRIDEDSA